MMNRKRWPGWDCFQWGKFAMLLGDRIAGDCRQLERRAVLPPRANELLLSPDLFKQTLMTIYCRLATRLVSLFFFGVSWQSACIMLHYYQCHHSFSFFLNSSFQRKNRLKKAESAFTLPRNYVITRQLFFFFLKSPFILFLWFKNMYKLKTSV